MQRSTGSRPRRPVRMAYRRCRTVRPVRGPSHRDRLSRCNPPTRRSRHARQGRRHSCCGSLSAILGWVGVDLAGRHAVRDRPADGRLRPGAAPGRRATGRRRTVAVRPRRSSGARRRPRRVSSTPTRRRSLRRPRSSPGSRPGVSLVVVGRRGRRLACWSSPTGLRRRSRPDRRRVDVLLPVLAVAPFVFPFTIGLLFGNADVFFPFLYGTHAARCAGGHPAAVAAAPASRSRSRPSSSTRPRWAVVPGARPRASGRPAERPTAWVAVAAAAAVGDSPSSW